MPTRSLICLVAPALVAACGGQSLDIGSTDAVSQTVPKLESSPCEANTVDLSTWSLEGKTPSKYAMGRDSSVTCNASASLALRSTAPASASDGDFGAAGNTVPAEYFGKRVRLFGFVKAVEVTGWAGLWMTAHRPAGGSGDNMQARAIIGTLSWRRYEVVVDIPADATSVGYGLLLSGEGSVWLSGVNLEVVDSTVPVTGT